METVEINSINFLRCDKEDCKWNIGWLSGSDWTVKPGRGTRLCNLGAKDMIVDKAKPPDNCLQPSNIFELARDGFQKFQS